MKKKLEADLISIAHRVLKLKNKADIIQLQQETLKLYEKLSVLRFVEENFNEVKPTITFNHIENKLVEVFDGQDQSIEFDKNELIIPEPEQLIKEVLVLEDKNEINVQDEVVKESLDMTEKTQDTAIEAIEIIQDQNSETEPIAELTDVASFEEKNETKLSNTDFSIQNEIPLKKSITLEDLLGISNEEPVFERVVKSDVHEKEPLETIKDATIEDAPKPEEQPTPIIQETKVEIPPYAKNDILKKIITLGLNDKIAFERHLFAGSSEDLNRVISQISTFDTLKEAQQFIDEMVKPDYNNWDGKDEYVKRFMEIVEKKFL